MKRYLERNRRLADYIYNDMDPEDVVMIEKELQSDPEFSEYYSLNREVKDYLQAKIQLEEMRSDPQLEDAERLAEMAFETNPPDVTGEVNIPAGRGFRRKTIRRITYSAAIAAAVSLIVALGMIPSSIKQDRLFERYYTPIAASDFTQRGVSSEVQVHHEIALGINYYMDGHYRQSIDQFGGLDSDPALLPEAQFFTALSYLGLGEYQVAQSMLESLAGADMRYQAEILWYLSLSCLKTGSFDKAYVHLTRLELYDGMYRQDAQILRKKLRRFKE